MRKAKEKSTLFNNTYEFFTTILHSLRDRLNQGDNCYSEYIEIRHKLLNMQEEKLLGHAIRSLDKNLNKGERTSLFHLARLRKRGQSNYISSILSNNDSVFTNKKDLLNESFRFFSDFFSQSVPSALHLQTQFAKLLTPLDSDSVKPLADDITVFEIDQAIQSASKLSSPGPDGLTYNFYKKFSALLSPDLNIIFNEFMRSPHNMSSLTEGVISLIPKVKQPSNFSEYRPITLLNADFIIFTKILSSRFKSVLPLCIGIEQTCSIEGRNIFHNLGAIKALLHYYEKHPCDQGAIIGVDFQRAFDSVSHEFLFICLNQLGLPGSIQNLIKAIYGNSFSQVIVNGHLTAKFPLRRGVRQGCPLSMLLFSIVAEPLIRRITQKISGLEINGIKMICRAYADDIFILLSKPNDFPALAELLQKYHAASGTKTNWSKSKYLPLGSWLAPLTPFSRTEEIKILGVTFRSKLSDSLKHNWSTLVHKIHTQAIQCLSKRLSLIQRVWYTNTYLLSKLWFLAQIFPPRKLDAQQVEKYIGYHIWRNHPCRVSREQLRLRPIQGGLGLVDVWLKCTALSVNHYTKLLNGTGDPFEVVYFKQYLPSSNINFQYLASPIRNIILLQERLMATNPSSITSTSYIYKELVNEKRFTSPIEGTNPSRNWPVLWRNLTQAPLPTEWKTSLYLVSNNAIQYSEKQIVYKLKHLNIN